MRDPDTLAEEPEVLRGGSQQITEAFLRDPTTPRGQVSDAHFLPHFGEDVHEEIPIMTGKPLLRHCVEDILAERFLLVRGQFVQHMFVLDLSTARGLAALLRLCNPCQAFPLWSLGRGTYVKIKCKIK